MKLNSLSNQILGDGGDAPHPNEFMRMQEFMQLREWIIKVEVLPFKVRSIYAGATVIFFTLQPLLVDIAKDAIKRFW